MLLRTVVTSGASPRFCARSRPTRTDPLQIAGLARVAAMSPYHFLRVFRAVVGMTPHQFILRTRLQNAAARLRHSSQPVLDIALDAGFTDLSTFNRRFHATLGLTPTAFRRSRRAT